MKALLRIWKLKTNIKGYSLPVVLFTASIVLATTTVGSFTLINQFSSLGRYRATMEAYAYAKAGVNAAVEDLSSDAPTLTTDSPLSSDPAAPGYTVRLLNDTSMTIQSTGTATSDQHDIKKTIAVNLERHEGSYTENFTNRTYRDPATTADWNYGGVLGVFMNWQKRDNTILAINDYTGTNGRISPGNYYSQIPQYENQPWNHDYNNTSYPMVIRDDYDTNPAYRYKMYYRGRGPGKFRVVMATSPDGLTWTKYYSSPNRGRPVIGTGDVGTGDYLNTFTASVIIDDSYDHDRNPDTPPIRGYRMWYTGQQDDASTSYPCRVYYAWSSDGFSWTKLDNSIPPDSNTTSTNGRVSRGTNDVTIGDSVAIYSPSVIKDADEPDPNKRYKMWYQGQGAVTRGYNVPGWGRIFLATSPDGYTWTKYDTSIPPNSDTTTTNGRIALGNSGTGDRTIAWSPWVIRDNDAPPYARFKMWYTGGYWENNIPYSRNFYATSPDGLTWTKYNNAIPSEPVDSGSNYSRDGAIPKGSTGKGDSNEAIEPNAMIDNGDYKMWYSGVAADGKMGIYYAAGVAGVDVASLPVTPSGEKVVTATVNIYPAADSSGTISNLTLVAGGANGVIEQGQSTSADVSEAAGVQTRNFSWASPGTNLKFNLALDKSEESPKPLIEQIVIDYVTSAFQIDYGTWRAYTPED